MELLLDSFGRFIPDTLAPDVIQSAEVVICKFNKNASLLASASMSGLILLWDTDLWTVKAPLYSHISQIVSLCWSENGTHLLSASKDWNCIIWNLQSFPQRTVIRTESPIVSAQFIPFSTESFIMIPNIGQVCLVTLESIDDGNNVDALKRRHSCRKLAFNDSDFEDQELVQYSCFDYVANKCQIILGGVRGSIVLLDYESCTIITRIRVSSMIVRELEYHDSGMVLVNSSDRIIRIYALEYNDDGFITLELKNKFQDQVDKILWSHVSFGNHGEYIVGGSGSMQKHNIYVWDLKSGNLENMLEGPPVTLEYFDWHPLKPQITSVSSQGYIYRWELKHKENWSAFAPGFEELEDNIEYEEREDEFDNRSYKIHEGTLENVNIEADISMSSTNDGSIVDAFRDHFVFPSDPNTYLD